jgi:hypothetical protein
MDSPFGQGSVTLAALAKDSAGVGEWRSLSLAIVVILGG